MSDWRLIIDPPLDARHNMAIDEAMLKAADSGLAGTPTLRLYEWREAAVSIGYLQDIAFFSNVGLPVVRRITGGRAVLHGTDLTYSFVLDSHHPLFSQGILGVYKAISRSIVGALRALGVDADFARPCAASDERSEACFHTPSRQEVLVNGKKIAGSAQRRLKNALLLHGSIMLSMDAGLLRRVFHDDPDALMNRMTWLGAHTSAHTEGLKARLVKSFSEGLDAAFIERGLDYNESVAVDRAMNDNAVLTDTRVR
ncbi:MAG: lipoate--protein ligase family protein [Deltaproteobacteria bacterium]|nr:lipoate--protein ligase family protein [Deltaproteobacteria bacterium]